MIYIVDLCFNYEKTLMYPLLLLLLLIVEILRSTITVRSFSPYQDFSHKNIGVDLLLL
jgi:hypothetical protein